MQKRKTMAIKHYASSFFNPGLLSASVQKYPQKGKRILVDKNRSNNEREIKKLEIVNDLLKNNIELHEQPGLIDLPRENEYDVPIRRRHFIKGYVPILDLRTCDNLLVSHHEGRNFDFLVEKLVMKKITDLNFHLPYLVLLLRGKTNKNPVQNLIVKRSSDPPMLTNSNEFSEAHKNIGFETMMGIDQQNENNKPFLFEGNNRTTKRKARIFGEMVLKQLKK